MRALQVWAWSGWENNNIQTREIMAAHSQAEVALAAGVKSPARLWNLGTTSNNNETGQAMSQPGTIFWHPRSEANLKPLSYSPRWRARARRISP